MGGPFEGFFRDAAAKYGRIDMCVDADGTLYFTGNSDFSISRFNRRGAPVAPLTGGKAAVRYISAGADGCLVALDANRVVQIWRDSASLYEGADWEATGPVVMGRDGAVYCVCGGRQSKPVVRVWRAGSFVSHLADPQVNSETIRSMTLGNNGTLYVGEGNGLIRMWSA